MNSKWLTPALVLAFSIITAGCTPKPRTEIHANPSLMVSKYIDLITPAAVAFARKSEREALQHGVPLNAHQLKIAQRAGVKNPRKVRLYYVDEFPLPADRRLKVAARRLAYTVPNMAASAFGYGVRLKKDQKYNDSLLAHELVHVRQAEQMGLLKHTREYLLQMLFYGYYAAPMEEEAYDEARKYL